MDPIFSSIQEYIKSGEYFADARKWYNFKYIAPLSHRSLLALTCGIFTILLTLICISINTLLPINEKVSYVINSHSNTHATVTDTKQTSLGDPFGAVVNIMVKNYVQQREAYDYYMLKNQFNFIQNTSTRVVYMQFANFMNIDNPLSPLMRYQKLFRRSVNVLSINNSNSEAVVTFESLAKSNTGEILENMVWEAAIGFIMDSISLNAAPGSPFNFTVTSYKLKLLKDKNKK